MPGLLSPLFGLDTSTAIERIIRTIVHQVRTTLRKEGVVVAVSGGIDSSLCAALCTRALGKEHVLTLALPERHSSAAAGTLAHELCSSLGIELLTIPIEGVLEAAGCYQSQAEAMQRAFPAYRPGDPFKIVLPSLLAGARLNIPRVSWKKPDSTEETARITRGPYLQLVAATNLKQRTRTMTAYFHADRLNRAVCGTPNRLEYDQGFFVKGGDGLSDFAPIAHLYKTQVYALGTALGLPQSILERQPTTDTFPLEQTQEEFYFSAPYAIMDACLYGVNHGHTAQAVAAATGLTPDQAERIFNDIEAKRRATQHLHLRALTVEPIDPIEVRLQQAAGESRR
jgi:NAD+ synthase